MVEEEIKDMKYRRFLHDTFEIQISNRRVINRTAVYDILKKDKNLGYKIDLIIDYFREIYEGSKRKLPKTDRFYVFQKYKGKCMWCHKQLRFHEMTIEHIHPLVMGGDYDLENLGCSCFKCNNFRSDKGISNDPESSGYLVEEL